MVNKLGKCKGSFLLFALALICVLGCSRLEETMAWLQKTAFLSNEFFSPVVDIEILEETDSNGLKNYKIQNNGNATVFIRTEVIASFTNSEGKVISSMNVGSGQVIEGTAISMNIGAAWSRGADGYYYYLSPVKAGETTELLFQTYSSTNNDLDFQLVVYAQAVLPENVEAWRATLDENANIVPPSS